MPLIATRGAASAQGFGEFAQTAVATYIEDVFSTYLYTGDNTNNRSFTNNIDLSGDGGLVWIKSRGPTAGIWHGLFDTARGANKRLVSNNSDAEGSSPAYGYVSAFNADGFTVTGGSSGYDNVNLSNENYASWTFRKAKKFFDVVTYTGNGQVSAQNIAHNLGSVPGMIIVKRTDTASNWAVYHRSMGATKFMRLNITNGEATSSDYWNNTEPTSTQFTVGIGGAVNDSGTYVAYLFAHDAGGFGDAGTDNVISCGSFTTNGSGIATVTLGYEPQWVLIKRTDSPSEWHLLDNMRGFSQGVDAWLRANSSAAESSAYSIATPTATGFVTDGTNIIDPSATFIYIAIRRGPMKTPTSGTSVFAPAFASSSGVFTATSNFPVDWDITGERTTTAKWYSGTRLITSATLQPNSTAAEFSDTWGFDNNTAFTLPNVTGNYSGWINWMFGRAPGFFDVVCYTGNGNASQLVTHNLGVAPELYICKRRNGVSSWDVWSKTPGVDAVYTLALQSTGAGIVNSAYNGYATATTIEVGGQIGANVNAATYAAYLFGSVAGVSKVGRYTGTGASQTVNCGFTGGARFVLIKRIDGSGDWWAYDSARGITSGNDPYLFLNSNATEVTGTNYIDTTSVGFQITATAPAGINANGGTFIFLAIA